MTLTAAVVLALGVAVPASAADRTIELGVQNTEVKAPLFTGVSNDCHGSGDACLKVVPGDHRERSIMVKNAGPEGGRMRAWITNVATEADRTEGSAEFFNDLSITWDGKDTPVSRLVGERTLIRDVALDRNASTELSVGYDFPESAMSGNISQVGHKAVTFDVVVEIQGDTPDTPETGTGNPWSPGGDTPTGGIESGVPGNRNTLGYAGGALVLLGGALMAYLSRRRDLSSTSIRVQTVTPGRCNVSTEETSRGS